MVQQVFDRVTQVPDRGSAAEQMRAHRQLMQLYRYGSRGMKIFIKRNMAYTSSAMLLKLARAHKTRPRIIKL